MVNTRASKRKSPPAANNANVASAKRTHRDISDDEEVKVRSDNPLILIQPRENDFSAKTWWMVDLSPLEETSLQGASALVKRCMRTYGWDETKARKILAAYRQFIILKKKLKDWDATILSPCHFVDQMWHCHILDVVNYCHDMMLLCGHVVGHNPDGALDSAAKQKRDEATRASLKEHFGRYDEAVWNFSSDLSERNVKDSAMKSEDISNDQGPTSLGLPMTIKIRDQGRGMVMFKVSRTAKMKVVFGVYADIKGMRVQDLRFFLHGDQVNETMTADDMELEDGDVIDCFLGQTAC